jgi:hypothetical protein
VSQLGGEWCEQINKVKISYQKKPPDQASGTHFSHNQNNFNNAMVIETAA